MSNNFMSSNIPTLIVTFRAAFQLGCNDLKTYLKLYSNICVQRIALKHCQSASHLTLLSSITICATINFYEPKYYQLSWELFKF